MPLDSRQQSDFQNWVGRGVDFQNRGAQGVDMYDKPLDTPISGNRSLAPPISGNRFAKQTASNPFSRVRKSVLTMRYRTNHDCRLHDGPRSPETQKEFYYYLRVNQSV